MVMVIGHRAVILYRHQACRPGFCINGQSIDYVGLDKYVHLGHVIAADLNDKDDIERCRSALVGQINNVICFFGKLDPVIKMKLLMTYCTSIQTVAVRHEELHLQLTEETNYIVYPTNQCRPTSLNVILSIKISSNNMTK